MNRFLLTAAISAALAQAAFAQGNNSPQDMQNNAPIPQEIKQKLQSAGYSDVKVMPTSFFVQAKDQQGDPVEILITPHSMMEVTALNASERGNVTSSAPSNSTNGDQ
jgi:hypothetical protein